jgi:predicted PurR-regulated permease PerM
LGATTAFLALIPFGPPIIWLPAGIWMLAQVSLWKGLGLLVWGALVVSGIDNVLRPFFIGSATRIPYLLVLFGVLGGLGAFGLLGLFLGPTILSVLLVVWREWAEQTGEPQTSGPPARESAPGS